MTSVTDQIAQANPFDHWKSISIALYMTLVGYGVLVGVPVISTAWVELLGFTEEQVGRVAGADLGGLSAGAILASFVIARLNRRWLIFSGLAIAVAANALCMFFESYSVVLWLRFMAGLGSGIYTGVAVATLGGTSKPARAFNMMLFLFAFSQAGEMYFLPMLSMNGIYWAFIIFYLFSLPFIRLIPAHPFSREMTATSLQTNAKKAPDIPGYMPWLCLAAIFFTYINIGTYWTYIELGSLDAGIDADWIGSLLVWVSFCSFVGCFVATVISNRFGLARPLLFTLAIMTLIVAILGDEISQRNLLISLITFSLLWIFIDVYQMSTIAVIDKTGSFATLMPGAQGLGQIVGPNIAASMLGAGMGYSAVFIMCACAALTGMFIYGAMYVGLKHRVPELAQRS